MRFPAALLSLSIAFLAAPAHAELVDHTYVKTLIESRFQLVHREVGMTPTQITSTDCDVQIVDESPNGLRDEAAVQISKNGKSLKFKISNQMSYDNVVGSFLDLVQSAKSGLVTHSTLLKISNTKLMITQLALYPNNAQADETFSITCHF